MTMLLACDPESMLEIRRVTDRIRSAPLRAVLVFFAGVGSMLPMHGASIQAQPAYDGQFPATVARPGGSLGVTRVRIDSVKSPAFEGRLFGETGAYERVFGRAFGELDPDDPLNAVIVNLGRAPKNGRGMVEYSMDFHIIKPVDMARGNRTLLYDVVNRGGRSLIRSFHVGAAPPDLGDGLLMMEGYTLVSSGWQGDVEPADGRLTISLPVPTQADGSPIRRRIATEYVFSEPEYSVPISYDRGHRDIRPYPAVEESMQDAALYQRGDPHAPPMIIPREHWTFAECGERGANPQPSSVDICMPKGFSTDVVYTLVYEARDPLVMGIGFAATRDLVSFLRYDMTAANPLVVGEGLDTEGQQVIRWAIGFGVSQSGRMLKDLIYQGFNQDTAGRLVFDGAIPLMSGARKTFVNYEFGMPARFSTGLEGHYSPGDEFPFGYETLTDPVTGHTDGILLRCREQNTCPKTMHIDSGTEPWVGRGSLVVTDPSGIYDVALPENVRVYYLAGTQHVPGRQPNFCKQPGNPLPRLESMRALLVALQRWITDGREPPGSRYPRLEDGSLVPSLPQAEQGFPFIPGVLYTGILNHLLMRDYSVQPPAEIPGTDYGVLVPRVDNDGNEVAGLRSVMLEVPLGTYAGWNLRQKGFMEDQLCYLDGSYVPFARSAVERGDDPRLSLEERYGTHTAYVQRVTAVTARLLQDGLLLPQDAERLLQAAEQRNLGLPRR